MVYITHLWWLGGWILLLYPHYCSFRCFKDCISTKVRNVKGRRRQCLSLKKPLRLPCRNWKSQPALVWGGSAASSFMWTNHRTTQLAISVLCFSFDMFDVCMCIYIKKNIDTKCYHILAMGQVGMYLQDGVLLPFFMWIPSAKKRLAVPGCSHEQQLGSWNSQTQLLHKQVKQFRQCK